MPRERTSWLRRLLAFRFLFVINIGILMILGISFSREFIRNREIQQDIAVLQAQADALQARNLQMAELYRTFQTESAIEREARLKLGLKKPGESVVVIRPSEAGASGEGRAGAENPLTVLASSDAGRSVANPAKWWYYFFDQESFRSLNPVYGN